MSLRYSGQHRHPEMQAASQLTDRATFVTLRDQIDIRSSIALQSRLAGELDVPGDPFDFARRLKTPVWVFDIDNSCVSYANQAACDMWQAETEEELRGRDLASDMSPTVAKRLKQYQSDFTERNATFSEMWTLYPKGVPTSAAVVFHRFILPDKRVAMLCEVVGNSGNEPDNLRSAEALLHTDIMITLFEMDGPAFYMNPAARNIVSEDTTTLANLFIEPADNDTLHTTLQEQGEHRMVAHVNTIFGPRWHDISAKSCLDAVTGKPAVLVTAIDVSELKIARDKARYLADRDQLTGCFNRAYLVQHMAMLEQDQTARCALLYFDIDNFKQINDRLGHEMGDEVLKEISARARRAIRKNDVVVRLGGDEFVIIFEDIPADDIFVSNVERLLKTISSPISHESTRVQATVSIGVSTFLPQTADLTAIMREADIALYMSKETGRNRATFFTDEMGTAANARDQIEVELRHAVENREFILHYQPRIDVKTGQVISVEGLVRWVHPDKGLVLPGQFIPICEDTGMIEELGHLVIEMGCEQAIFWHQNGQNIELSLNISPRQFEDKRLIQSLETYAAHPDFPRGKIELEITERVLVGDHSKIETKLEAISQMGYRIAIDDFGTGYSNLSYISRFPLNCLKIDQSFTKQLPKSGPIITLILTLARQIGATVVAEGVETQSQLDWLSTHECSQVQGFHLAKPMPLAELDGAITEINAKRRTL